MRIGQNAKKTVFYVVLICWGVVQVFPLYFMFTFALKSNIELFSGNILSFPTHPKWRNFYDALMLGDIGRFLLNSMTVTVSTVVITVVLCLMATFAIVRMHHNWTGRLTALFLFGLTVPAHAALLPVFVMLRDFRLTNSHVGLVLPYVGFAIPITFLVFAGFMVGIPKELDEAAVIDGCGAAQLFVRIICPLMAPAVATACIFTFLSSWNELMFAVVYISDERLKTLTVGLQSLKGKYTTDWGLMGAGMVMGTMPILVLYITMSKKVQESLTIGAVKG